MAKGNRRKPNLALQRRIIIEQTGRCGYCNSALDEKQIHFDHFIPHAYSQTNSDQNWVAACPDCNLAKSDRHLALEADLTAFCLEMVKLHGSFGDGWPEWPSFANLRHSEADLEPVFTPYENEN